MTRNEQDYGLDPILAIHDPQYVDYLRTIYPQWYGFAGCPVMNRVKEGGDPEAGVVPEMMLHKNLLPVDVKVDTTHSIGRVGLYHYDMSSTITAREFLFLARV
jgi:hypothetical protein